MENQDIAAVLDEGDDALDLGAGLGAIVFLRGLGVLGPETGIGVDIEAVDRFFLAPAPAEIHAPDGGGGAVVNGDQGGAIAILEARLDDLLDTIFLGILQGCE